MEIGKIENDLDFQLYPFPENTMRILDGRIKLKKVPKPENYLSRRLVVRNDGSLVLILERFIELKQLETYYINGIPQSSTKVLYNFNEIGMLFLNLQHQLDTCLRIDKEQLSGPNTSYMLGFGSYLCEDGIHLVYNQDISKSNEIIDVVVRPDFEMIFCTCVFPCPIKPRLMDALPLSERQCLPAQMESFRGPARA
jgi:hypothetical protein